MGRKRAVVAPHSALQGVSKRKALLGVGDGGQGESEWHQYLPATYFQITSKKASGTFGRKVEDGDGRSSGIMPPGARSLGVMECAVLCCLWCYNNSNN